MLESAFLLDIFTLTICAVLLLRFGRLSLSHPAISYFVFHVYVITQRLFGLLNGAPLLFSNWSTPGLEPVRIEEIVRASVLADLVVFTITLAWLHASLENGRFERGVKPTEKERKPQISLSRINIIRIAAITIPLGIIGLWLGEDIPIIRFSNRSLFDITQSSYILILGSFFGFGLFGLIYWYGFKPILVAPLSMWIVSMSLQGGERFKLILSILLIAQIYLDRRGMRWPTRNMVYVLSAVIIIFFPLKEIGTIINRSGFDIDAIGEQISSTWENLIKGSNAESNLLDQFASALTLIDRNEKIYYGETYLALITLPVPREWWPDKPELTSFIREISTRQRPMSTAGMIVTFIGELYLNFRYVGVFFGAYFFAYLMAKAYYTAYRSHYYSVMRLAYLTVAASLLQVYRDGLVSLVVFPFVHMMPLMLMVLLHFVSPSPEVRLARLKRQFPKLDERTFAYDVRLQSPPLLPSQTVDISQVQHTA